jgi:intein/homing endonuclease
MYSIQKLTWIIRRGTKEEQTAFLSALFGGDGSLQNSNVSYFSLSDKLLSEVQQMLLNFGIYAKRSSPALEWQLFEESGVSGSLLLTGTNAEKFISDIGFLFSRKQDKVLVDEVIMRYLQLMVILI